MNLDKYIEDNTLRIDASRRGGGIEIDASGYTGIEGAKMTAYQNYLGGGMLGAIASSHNFHAGDQGSKVKADELTEALKRYFHNITNEQATEWDEWAESSYEANQSRPKRGY